MRLILAPMEGVVDYYMRELLTGIGGYDLCVTEFLRVTNTQYPNQVFYRICPEINPDTVSENIPNNDSEMAEPFPTSSTCSIMCSKTKSNVPVHLQLLGQNAQMMALNAAKAVSLGVAGIDLNFGCPAKTVNRHKGGAALLNEPDELANIIANVRAAMPSDVRLSVKMRLGWNSTDNAVMLAKLVEQAGANELAVHARTKAQGYKPPVHWHIIADIRQALSINVVANGDVIDINSYHQCKQVTGCEDVMIGRGALMNPFLAFNIKNGIEDKPKWGDVVSQLMYKKEMMKDSKDEKYFPSRTKQWLNYLRQTFPEAERDFSRVRLMQTSEQISQYFEGG